MKERRIENIGFGGLKLIQDEDGFRFGIDAVILADFANSIYPDASRVVDLGTGNGIIPFIISYKNTECNVTGIDVQEKAIDMAKESCMINGLEERVDFICTDILHIHDKMDGMKSSVDCVVSNPPYVAKGSGIKGNSKSRMIARRETTADIEDFIRTAASLLKERGHFFMVHRPSRLVDIFYFCRKHRLEPKDVRFVAPSEGKPPNIVLVHCVLGGGRELNYLERLNVYGQDGEYSPEIMAIYEKIG